MSTLSQIIISINALFFLLYGLQCFISPVMKLEFKRFGLTEPQRIATGVLQLLGAAGVVVGFFIPLLGFLAASGLALMMLSAFAVRIKIKDGFFQSAPSLIFLFLNGWIATVFYSAL
ncbi:MAG: DoxX family protein [Bacteroidetes bacterium]|nr:DoxX family protein [Bacteroidota bacterium]MCH8524612.1 DoxX family protein [Balneolales bacterium]